MFKSTIQFDLGPGRQSQRVVHRGSAVNNSTGALSQFSGVLTAMVPWNKQRPVGIRPLIQWVDYGKMMENGCLMGFYYSYRSMY